MKRLFLIMSALTIMIISCNPTVIKYSSTYFVERTPENCAIVIPEHIGVFYQGDVENEFGKGDKKELISNFFRTQLRNEIAKKAIFKTVFQGTPTNTFRREGVAVSTRRGEKSFFIPVEKERITCQGGTPDIVLALDEIDISSSLKIKSSPGYSSGGFTYGGSFSTSKNLVIMAKFMIWDNIKGELVSYGFVEIVDENRFAVSMEDWNKVMDDFASKLLEKTPFRKGVI